ncbi:MAG: hypothetical protein FWD63_04245 [Propionibacteriaceae bacterium]|nr:hypothetical protein [Propionibacteriaceae bacterium]
MMLTVRPAMRVVAVIAMRMVAKLVITGPMGRHFLHAGRSLLELGHRLGLDERRQLGDETVHHRRIQWPRRLLAERLTQNGFSSRLIAGLHH